MDLHAQRLDVVCAISSSGEVREVELNLVPAFVQSHGHGAMVHTIRYGTVCRACTEYVQSMYSMFSLYNTYRVCKVVQRIHSMYTVYRSYGMYSTYNMYCTVCTLCTDRTVCTVRTICAYERMYLEPCTSYLLANIRHMIKLLSNIISF